MIETYYNILFWFLVGAGAAIIVTIILFKITQIISAAWQSGKNKFNKEK